MKILVLESSTSSIKAMVYNTENQKFNVMEKKHAGQNNGQGIHNPEEIYKRLLRLGARAVEGHVVDAIALSSTWHSLMIGDEQFNPISPIYLWSNPMAGDLCEELRKDEAFAEAYRIKTGCIVNASYPYFKLRFMYEGQDDYVEKKSSLRIMDQGVFLNLKFTGKYVTSESMVSGSGLYNIDIRDYDNQLLKSIGLRKEQFPKIVSNTAFFPLMEDVAQALGVEKNIPVITTNPDGGLNQIGAESLENSAMTLSVGTSGALRMSVNQPNTSEVGLWNYRSPRSWLIGTATSGACNCVDWFKESFCENRYSYQELEEKMEQATSLNEAPIFLPFLFGERGPGWDTMRLGGFVNLKNQASVGDCYYSVLEGVLFNLYQGYEILIRAIGEPETIQLSGGILNSDQWMQMCSDIFGKAMTVNSIKDMSMLGAAKWTKYCINPSNSKNEDANISKAEERQVIWPNMGKHKKYKQRYQKYLTAYFKNA